MFKAAFAKRKLLGAAVFVAMGSSAVLMISNQVVQNLAEVHGILAAGACILCFGANGNCVEEQAETIACWSCSTYLGASDVNRILLCLLPPL